jgi:hemerythrin-like metal-binding protein
VKLFGGFYWLEISLLQVRKIMHRFQFEAELETGNPDIDSQHQTIFAMANEVMYSRKLEQNPKRFHRGMLLFRSYLEDHFAAEESAMLKHGYDSRRFHVKFHDYIRREVRAIVARLSQDNAVEKTRAATYVLLEAWVLFHVRHADCHFAAFLREQGSRMPRVANVDQAFADRLNVILQKQAMVGNSEGVELLDCRMQEMHSVVKGEMGLPKLRASSRLQQETRR